MTVLKLLIEHVYLKSVELNRLPLSEYWTDTSVHPSGLMIINTEEPGEIPTTGQIPSVSAAHVATAALVDSPEDERNQRRYTIAQNKETGSQDQASVFEPTEGPATCVTMCNLHGSSCEMCK